MKWTKEEEKTLTDQYSWNPRIFQIINHPKSSIIDKANKLGLKAKGRPSIENFNISFFDTFTPDSAYCLGMIATDGYIYTNYGHSEIGIVQKEKDILCKIASLLNLPESYISESFDKKIQKIYYRLRFTSSYMVKRLGGIGIKPRKTATIGRLGIPKCVFGQFLLGVIDGDGSIYDAGNGRPRLEICSNSWSFLNSLQAKIRKYYSLPKRKIAKHNGSYRIAYSDGLAMRLLMILYSNKPSLFLERKFDKFAKFLNNDGCQKGYHNMPTNAKSVEDIVQ